MKKIINIILVVSILASYFIPINFDVYADDCTTGYKVSVLASNGASTTLSCHADYNSAKIAMLNYNSTESNIAVIYDNKGALINAKYAIAKLKPGRVINIYPTASSLSKYTSIHTSYGSDAAFIDYDPVNGRTKIRISGYSGWVDSESDTNLFEVLVDNIRIRSEHSVPTGDPLSNIIGHVYYKERYKYYETYNDGTYTWYRIKTEVPTSSGGTEVVDGWVASPNNPIEGLAYPWIKKESSLDSLTIIPINQIDKLQTFYEPYADTGNLIHYYEHQENGYPAQTFTNLGISPDFLAMSTMYYSFDGNYYYTNLTDMLDDYRDNTNSRAINSGEPYYPYFLYLSTHSKTGYTANDFNQIIKDEQYTRNVTPGVKYIECSEVTGECEWIDEVSRTGISLMYNKGQEFVDVANTYGINALMMFGTALNESASGTSKIAFYKNNLFGLGAIDSSPVIGARSYPTVKDSIIDFAKFTGSNDSSYTNPTRTYYFGSHYGNKGSGMNVNYATDPYWGEKQVDNSFNNDRRHGGLDHRSNTIGVTKTSGVNIYKNPSGESSIIYSLKNKYKDVLNMPVIVADKVYVSNNGAEEGWYRVYTDPALDENQDIADVNYEFNKSYGYILESDLYVDNNQPVINASDISITQGDTLDLLNGVTATDVEDGNISNKITVSGDYDTTIPNTYTITYTVVDNNGFSASKEISLTVNPAEDPYIEATDRTISQYVPFDPLEGVSANDYRDGDITDDIQIIDNTVDINTKGSYIVTYSVTNSLGNTTEKTITIEVIENTSPIINVNNKIIKVYDNFNPLDNVTATDLEDGDLSSNVEVISNNVDIEASGVYQITYRVQDSVGNIATKEITVTVEERNYVDKNGEFYFEKMEWNETDQTLDVAGYLAITGMNNTINENIRYDLIFKNNVTEAETIIPLERWLEGHPSRHYTDSIYNYSDTWFKGSVDLSILNQGEYTLHIRARSGNNQAINFFRNVFGKEMTRKTESNTGRGYFFRNNNYKKEYPIELFVRDNGLITDVEPPHSSNMFTSYRTLDFENNSLNILGTSFNVNGDYSKDTNVERYLILENKETFERYTYNIGSIVGSNIPLRVSDGKSKVRGWFDTTDKVDLTDIPVGNYIIYIRTKTGSIDDYGELNDIFIKSTTMKAIINNKEFSISLNKDLRFRLELNVINE